MTIDDEKLRLWLEAAIESAFRAGAVEERAAVVAYLRESSAADEFGAVADAITKEAALSPTGHGEHRAGGAR